MQTDNGFAIAFFVVVIGGTIAIGIANDITAPLCEAAKIKSMAPDKIEFGCFEFWLNRYQSLIGSVLASAVAGTTLLWIVRQFAVSHRQTAIAGATALRLRTQELEEKRTLIVQLLRILPRLMARLEEIEVPIPMVALEHIKNRLSGAWDDLAESIRKLETFELSGADSLAAAPRRQALMFLLSLQNTVSLTLMRIDAIQRHGGLEASPHRDNLLRHWANNRRRAMEAETALRQMDGGLKAEIFATRKQIQNFEKIAIGA
ncbi:MULTISPECIES: hypothetical protein [unclassified Bosea (in: a-proteobacteria)]|uniref:hypothetical protein n=1 Tax=unclassified Bosea (in: a-proteobacteria) TaxID=2653178 RepID=UPI000F758E2D|nr:MULTISPECIES: hypothetical protein [unclassified Bosea (in: a-proteobacteria)]AZO76605.1 hypothetical protein BLM15_02525 [Bosea sp. Tri-49]RXT21437.1 hypothetical protein B5U98_13140 [Bosea sp. Tri-39]RXT31776.1 hypothetical protein B5U99_23985 [Bosea sp. Tri-54]